MDRGPESEEALRARYAEERAKRLRPEGPAQYMQLRELEELEADPYMAVTPRDPLDIATEVLVIGSGWGGIATAAMLRKQGVDDIRIIDKAGDFGGTWYWNRYPGCMCDVESYLYLPFLEETGYMPKHKYAHASEIYAYAQLLGRHFGLYERAIFHTEVVDAGWDDAQHRWMVRTNRGDTIGARFIAICGGVMHTAKLPNIPGITEFAGEAFHTSRWDYSVTGGGPEEPMDKLADKVVGIIGTGATGVQAVPKLAEASKHLYVFQRTPSTVSARNQRETDPEWFREMSSEPGWQAARSRNFMEMLDGKRPEVDLVNDGWTELLSEDTRRMPADAEEAARLEHLDFQRMQKIRDRIASIVRDPLTAEKLKPYYKLSCKRPCFHDEYLPAFNRDNVTLVDTDGRGVERVTSRGVVVNGREYPLDVLVFASGFDLGSSYAHKLGFDPRGENGVSLSEAWAEGPSTAFGIMSRGFPNMLMNGPTQGGQGVNFTFALTETAKQMAYVVGEATRRQVTKVQPTAEAQDEWLNVIFGAIMTYGTYYLDCTPGYYNNEGAPAGMDKVRGSPYWGSQIDWAQMLESWRNKGDCDGFELIP